MGTISASSDAHETSAGNTVDNEMKDKSATTRSTCPPMASRVSSRTLVRSSTVTRSSDRRDHASWPYPTSTATTSRAPRSSSTSVNPPVDAPASRQRATGDRDLEGVQCADELVRAAGHPGALVGRVDRQPRAHGDRGCGLGGGHPVDADPTRADQFRGLLPRTRQAAPHQLGVDTSTPCHVRSAVQRF